MSYRTEWQNSGVLGRPSSDPSTHTKQVATRLSAGTAFQAYRPSILLNKPSPDRLLDYHVVDRWGPLCEFLGVEIPETPFPHVNKTNQFLAGRRRRWWRTFGLMVAKVSLPAVIAGIAGWWARAYSCIGCNRLQCKLNNFWIL